MGALKSKINDQGRKFVNEICKQLHELTGVEQRVTSAYHPPANRLVERQNRTIKNSLVKVLEDNPEMWPQIIEGILFAHRVSRHSSMKYTVFFYKNSFYKNHQVQNCQKIKNILKIMARLKYMINNLESTILILHQESALFTVECLLFTMECLQFGKTCVRNQHTNQSKHS